MKITEINKFWDWFSKNCQDFGSNFDNAQLLDELDMWVSKLGDFSWEVGPGKVEANALVISPNGDVELLEDTKEIVRNAKGCVGWEYYYAKPSKIWDLIFDFETSDEKMITMNASEWEYGLLKYEDGMFTIIIKAPNLKQLCDADQLTVAEIVLDGILGEELRMQTICEIELVEEFEKQYQKKSSNISSLLSHLKTIA